MTILCVCVHVFFFSFLFFCWWAGVNSLVEMWIIYYMNLHNKILLVIEPRCANFTSIKAWLSHKKNDANREKGLHVLVSLIEVCGRVHDIALYSYTWSVKTILATPPNTHTHTRHSITSNPRRQHRQFLEGFHPSFKQMFKWSHCTHFWENWS